MTLMGAAIGLTGRSVPFAFLIATLIVIGYALPYVLINSVARVKGGSYTIIGMLASPKLTGVQCFMNIIGNLGKGMYGISLASYFIDFFGVGDKKFIAIILVTLFYLVNVFGVDKMAKLQNVIVVFLCVALGVFVVSGIGRVQLDYFSSGFMPGGLMGLLEAGALLTNAVAGGAMVTSLSGEAKHPTRDIPLVIIISTLVVAVLYGFVAVVAAGVLPVSAVAGKNLSIVAREILSRPVYAFFMVAGAMFAIASTLNSSFAMGPRPLLQAVRDGWLPKWMGYVHPKYHTPVVLLTLLYIISVVTILSGLSIRTLANMSIICAGITLLIVCLAILRLPRVCPTGWKNSKFKCSKTTLTLIVVYATAAELFNIYLNLRQLSQPIFIGNIVMIIIAFAFAKLRYKHTHITPSYEENQGEA